MPRICTICAHAQRAEIEQQIVEGVSNRGIARHFAVGDDAVQRHATSHIAASIKQAQQAKEEAQSLDVVKQLKVVNGVALKILKETSADPLQYELALKAIDRVVKQLELQSRLLGDLDERPQINITLTPEWQAIRSAIVGALSAYPDARIAVAAALSRLEVSRAQLN